MLEELELRDLGPIDSATITPAPSMTAITGETGAGKSMLLNALRMISGGTADASRVASGADQAWAQGIFALGERDPLRAMLAEAGIPVDDDGLFLSRSVPAKGRSRSVLCGKSVPRSLLGEVASNLITIHGQTDQLRIASVARQREFIDAYARDDKARESFNQSYEKYRSVCERLRRLQTQESSMRQQADYLRDSIARIDHVDPHDGELEELMDQRDRIEHAEQITSGVEHALAYLDASQFESAEGAAGVGQLIAGAVQSLRGIHAVGDYEQLAERLESAGAEIDDVVFSLSRSLDADGETGNLDSINGRIHDLNELAQRWGPTLADVLQWRDRAKIDVEDLDASPEQLHSLEQERDRLRDEAIARGRALSKARTDAANALSAQVNRELGQLAMSGAKLDIVVTTRNGEGMLDATGIDDIEFLFTPFPGSASLPMGKSASGGELSRLMLALELCAADSSQESDSSQNASAGMTFIFDEVDAGVGGKAAVELGRRLAKLARRNQVIVVTHLPQVASWAERQYVVSKETGKEGTHTTVREVSGGERVREIARMLAGSESKTSLEHARELLHESEIE